MKKKCSPNMHLSTFPWPLLSVGVLQQEYSRNDDAALVSVHKLDVQVVDAHDRQAPVWDGC